MLGLWRGAPHFRATQDVLTPEVGARDPGVGLSDGVEELAGELEAGVGAVVRLGGEAHTRTVRAAVLVLGRVGARRVPGEAVCQH